MGFPGGREVLGMQVVGFAETDPFGVLLVVPLDLVAFVVHPSGSFGASAFVVRPFGSFEVAPAPFEAAADLPFGSSAVALVPFEAFAAFASPVILIMSTSEHIFRTNSTSIIPVIITPSSHLLFAI